MAGKNGPANDETVWNLVIFMKVTVLGIWLSSLTAMKKLTKNDNDLTATSDWVSEEISDSVVAIWKANWVY